MDVSFGRKILIQTNDRYYKKNPFKVSKEEKDIFCSVMGYETSVFDKETSVKAGNFLRANIGDFSPETGAVIRNINGETYLFTGEEAKRAKEIIKKSNTERKNLEKYYERQIPKDKNSRSEMLELQSKELQKIYLQNVGIRCNKELEAMSRHEGETYASRAKLEVDIQGKDLKLTYSAYPYKSDFGAKRKTEIFQTTMEK